MGYLVPIDQVPSMQERHVQACAARAAALAAPWTELLLRVLETERYQEAATGGAKPLAEPLGIEPGEVERCLVALTQAGVVEKRGGHYKVIGSLSVDACGALSQLQRHCLEVAQSRAGHRDDWFAYNAISVSAEDLESIHAKLKQTYREIRGMVAKSAPSQRAALLMMNLMRFDTLSEGE